MRKNKIYKNSGNEERLMKIKIMDVHGSVIFINKETLQIVRGDS